MKHYKLIFVIFLIVIHCNLTDRLCKLTQMVCKGVKFCVLCESLNKSDVVCLSNGIADELVAHALAKLDHEIDVLAGYLREIDERSAYDTEDRPDKDELKERKKASGQSACTVLLLHLHESFLISFLIVAVFALKLSLLAA